MNAYWKGIVLGLVVLSAPVMAQEKPAVWDLKSCINYARAHNIQWIHRYAQTDEKRR